MTPDTVVVLSGGIDSTVALALYRAMHRTCLAVSVNYGQRHLKELTAARQVAAALDVPHTTIEAPGLAFNLPGSSLTDDAVPVPEGHYAAPSMRDTVVPGRNAILISMAAGVAAAHAAREVIVGVHAGDHPIYPDCRPAFIDALGKAITLGIGDAAPRLVAPFVTWSKTEIVALGYRVGAPLHLTWSCYVGGDLHCGRCGTCVERMEAFRDSGVADPTTYAPTPAGPVDVGEQHRRLTIPPATAGRVEGR